MLEEPAMFKPLSFSSEFAIIRQYSGRSIGHAQLQVKSIDQAVQFYHMSMVYIDTGQAKSNCLAGRCNGIQTSILWFPRVAKQSYSVQVFVKENIFLLVFLNYHVQYFMFDP